MVTKIFKGAMMAVVLLACSATANAQDLLVKLSGKIEKVKILEITSDEVKYKLYGNPEGPTFTVRQNQLFSIQLEDGTVQKFGETVPPSVSTNTSYQTVPQSTPVQTVAPTVIGSNTVTTTQSAPSTLYGKGYDSVLSFYLQDGWGIGWDIRKNFSQYIGWDIFGISYMSGFYSPTEAGSINIRLAGVRAYTPSFSGVRGYANLDLGYTANYMSVYDWYGDSETEFFHGFGMDFGIGIQYKRVTLGYNLNYFAGDFSSKSHWARIGIIF